MHLEKQKYYRQVFQQAIPEIANALNTSASSIVKPVFPKGSLKSTVHTILVISKDGIHTKVVVPNE